MKPAFNVIPKVNELIVTLQKNPFGALMLLLLVLAVGACIYICKRAAA